MHLPQPLTPVLWLFCIVLQSTTILASKDGGSLTLEALLVDSAIPHTSILRASPTPTNALELRQVANAGVGGAGNVPAAAQPAANAVANAVTTVMVVTVVGGVTQTVASVFTQSAGAGVTAPSFKRSFRI